MCLLYRHQDLPQHFIQRLHGGDLHPLPRGVDIVIHDAQIHHIQTASDLLRLGVKHAALHAGVDLHRFRFPIVAVESGTSARGNLDAWFAEQGVTFLPNYSVRTSSTVIPFVEQGLAIGILPSLFAQGLLVQEGFFTLRPP